jgi:hypothetical protein
MRPGNQRHGGCHHVVVHGNNRTGSFRCRSAGDVLFGNKDLAAASDGELLRLGKVVCDGLGIEGLGFRRVVERLVRSEARPTTTEATALIRSAVRNLCPAQASAVPA